MQKRWNKLGCDVMINTVDPPATSKHNMITPSDTVGGGGGAKDSHSSGGSGDASPDVVPPPVNISPKDLARIVQLTPKVHSPTQLERSTTDTFWHHSCSIHSNTRTHPLNPPSINQPSLLISHPIHSPHPLNPSSYPIPFTPPLTPPISTLRMPSTGPPH